MSHVKVSEVKKNIKKHKNIMAEQHNKEFDGHFISYDSHQFIPKALRADGSYMKYRASCKKKNK